MKVPLTTTIVKNLKLESKPAGYANGKITYQPNPDGKEYILFCSHQDSPPGFGVKVAGKKTWIIQRRVSATKVIKATVPSQLCFFRQRYDGWQEIRLGL